MGAIEALEPAELAQELLGERRSILTGHAFLERPLANAEHTARSSAELRCCGPCESGFSRGRSSAGQLFIRSDRIFRSR